MSVESIKKGLLQALRKKKVFWPFDESDDFQISDEMLIEKVLIHCDLGAIDKLFDIFPKAEIQIVWENRILINERYHSMNLLFAYLLFNIADPTSFVKERVESYIQKLSL
jgi:hypothetical protein